MILSGVAQLVSRQHDIFDIRDLTICIEKCARRYFNTFIVEGSLFYVRNEKRKRDVRGI